VAATERDESWCWFALRAERPADAAAAAAVHRPDGECLGVLTAWEPGADPPGAMKIDARAIDPGGQQASASLVLAPEGTWLPFDDPAVSHAIRDVLLGRPADVLSTLLRDDFRFVGAIHRGTSVAGSGTHVAGTFQLPRVVPVAQQTPVPAPAGAVEFDLRADRPDLALFPRRKWVSATRDAVREVADHRHARERRTSALTA